MPAKERILVVRRDNIGDLILTTPLLSALRRAKPDAWIGILVNSYSSAVLAGNPDVDAVFAYDKAKHRPDKHRLMVYFETMRLIRKLRRLAIDQVLLAGPGAQHQAYSLCRWVNSRSIIGFVTPDFHPPKITNPVPYGEGAKLHEVQDIWRLLAPLGIEGPIPPCRVYADSNLVRHWSEYLAAKSTGDGPLIAIQLSARRVKQRWPAIRFASLIQMLHVNLAARFVLLWSPGTSEDTRHPGDDAKAVEVCSYLPTGLPMVACPTKTLADLVAVVSLATLVITPDGGAMHVAAGLDKPVVALFGDSSTNRWHPWQTPHRILQGRNQDVADIDVSSVFDAAMSFMR